MSWEQECLGVPRYFDGWPLPRKTGSYDSGPAGSIISGDAARGGLLHDAGFAQSDFLLLESSGQSQHKPLSSQDIVDQMPKAHQN